MDGDDFRRISFAQFMMTAAYVNDAPSVLEKQFEKVFISHRTSPFVK